MARAAAVGHRQVAAGVEDEVGAQLPDVSLLRYPGPSPDGGDEVGPEIGVAERAERPAAADPKDFAAHFQLALAYSLLGRDADAIPQYKTTLELHPGMYEAELNLGLSLMRTDHPPDTQACGLDHSSHTPE